MTAAALVSITINPSTATIPLGMTQQFTATGTFTRWYDAGCDANGTLEFDDGDGCDHQQHGATAGLATSLGTGTTTIGISSGGVSASAQLIVNPAALVSIVINPQTPTIALGTTQQFTATGTYTDGSMQDVTSVVTWSSSSATVAIISNATAQPRPGHQFRAGNGYHHRYFRLRLLFHHHHRRRQATVSSIAVTPSSASITWELRNSSLPSPPIAMARRRTLRSLRLGHLQSRAWLR